MANARTYNPGNGASSVALTDIESRRRLIFEARKAGFAIEAIAEQFGVSTSTVANDLRVTIARVRAEVDMSAREYRSMELERLDKLQATIWTRATTGDLQAQKGVLRIMERRARLLGLDMPQRIDQDVLKSIVNKLERRGHEVGRFFEELDAQLDQDVVTVDAEPLGPDETPADASIVFDS